MEVKCISCGATQNINESSNCSYCGNAIELESAKENYKTSLSGEIGNLMAMAETATEAGNWEEAVNYYNRVLEKDITNSDAWLGKGVGMVNTSTIGNIKINEAISYWKNAIKHSDNQQAMSKRVAREINATVVAFYPVLEKHLIKFMAVDNAYSEFMSKFILLESALNYASELDPENISIAENGIELCKRVIPENLAKKKPNNLSQKEEIRFIAIASLDPPEALGKIEQKYVEKIRSIDPERKVTSSIKDSIEKEKATDKAVKQRYTLSLVLFLIWGAFIIGLFELGFNPGGAVFLIGAVVCVILGIAFGPKLLKNFF